MAQGYQGLGQRPSSPTHWFLTKNKGIDKGFLIESTTACNGALCRNHPGLDVGGVGGTGRGAFQRMQKRFYSSLLLRGHLSLSLLALRKAAH